MQEITPLLQRGPMVELTARLASVEKSLAAAQRELANAADPGTIAAKIANGEEPGAVADVEALRQAVEVREQAVVMIRERIEKTRATLAAEIAIEMEPELLAHLADTVQQFRALCDSLIRLRSHAARRAQLGASPIDAMETVLGHVSQRSLLRLPPFQEIENVRRDYERRLREFFPKLEIDQQTLQSQPTRRRELRS